MPELTGEAIGTIYDCAIDSQCWPKAIEAIARLVDGGQGVILTSICEF